MPNCCCRPLGISRNSNWAPGGMGTAMPGPGNPWETGEPPTAHPQLPADLEVQPMNNHTLFFPPLESICFLIQPHTARNVSSFRPPTRESFLASGPMQDGG